MELHLKNLQKRVVHLTLNLSNYLANLSSLGHKMTTFTYTNGELIKQITIIPQFEGAYCGKCTALDSVNHPCCTFFGRMLDFQVRWKKESGLHKLITRCDHCRQTVI